MKIFKKNSQRGGVFLAVLMLLLASCSQDAGLDSANGTGSTDNTESNEGTISFTLGGAAGKTTTRATTTAAADSEKEITSLYAVLFRSTSDNAGSAANGTQDRESPDDIFIKAVSLTATGTNVTTAYNANDGTATFKAPTDNYQICFIANPGTELATAINSLELGVSTIKDFKALVGTQAPDTKPMLMTSNFYTAKVTKSTAADLGTVSMVRAMARIDVVNKANGITVTDITFKNRTVKTDLINDNNATLNTDYLESTGKEYTSLALKGNSDGSSKYTEAIYTYEQYGTGDNAPEMEITYTIDGQTGKTYKHTVKFEKTEGEEATTKQINLERNHLYTVILTNDADKLIVSLTVADWSEGTVFEVTNRKLIIGTDEDRCDVALGDIMISDGKIVKPDNLSTYLTSNTTAKAIGVVAYLYTDDSRIGNGVKTTLATNGVTAPCGLVLALKNVDSGNKVYWETTSGGNATLGDSRNYTKSLNALYYDNAIDGCEATKLALALAATNKRPTVFTHVDSYRTSYPAPKKTTDWYLPSVGEWIDILGADGLGGANVSSIKNSSSSAYSVSGVATTARNNLDAALAKAGTYDKVLDEYWSSSEYSDSQAYNMDLKNSALRFKYWTKTSSFSYARCILAF